MSAIGTTISRTRRQMLESLSNSSRDVPFVVDDIVAVLTVTDENEKAIMASVNSHYAAAKPNTPFRVVLVAERADATLTKAFEELRRTHTNLLLFLKEELARQVRAVWLATFRACGWVFDPRMVSDSGVEGLLPHARSSSRARTGLSSSLTPLSGITEPDLIRAVPRRSTF